jgi:hypothetical protein
MSNAIELVPADEEQKWEERLTAAARNADQSQWEIGDLIVEADTKWGEKYLRAAEVTGRPEKTLRNYVRVASKFDMARRRDNLTFGHHDAVAGLDTAGQDAWLDKAMKNNWSVSVLRTKLPSKQAALDPKERVVVMIPRGQYPSFIDAAGVRGGTEEAMKKAVAEWLLELGKQAASIGPAEEA